MISEIQLHIKELCEQDKKYGMRAYNTHFLSTVKYAKILAEKLGADVEIVEIAAWLHDVASIRGDYEDHHIKGAEYAEKYLKEQFNYPQEKIDQIKHCIHAHRGSKDIKRETVESECVASADAMSHFDDIAAMFGLAYIGHKVTETEEAKQFVKSKLQRSWNKLIPEAKDIIKDKYEAAMLLLG